MYFQVKIAPFHSMLDFFSHQFVPKGPSWAESIVDWDRTFFILDAQCTYIYSLNYPNVGKYAIHWVFGHGNQSFANPRKTTCPKNHWTLQKKEGFDCVFWEAWLGSPSHHFLQIPADSTGWWIDSPGWWIDSPGWWIDSPGWWIEILQQNFLKPFFGFPKILLSTRKTCWNVGVFFATNETRRSLPNLEIEVWERASYPAGPVPKFWSILVPWRLAGFFFW